MNEYIPFHAASSRSGFHAIPEFKLSHLDHAPSSLTQYFCVRSAGDKFSFGYAARDVAQHCRNNVIIEPRRIIRSYVDPDSHRPSENSLNLIFVGCNANIDRSVSALQKFADTSHPGGYDDTAFSPYDLDPRAVLLERRARHLEQISGLPAGMIDKTNSVFIVTKVSDAERISSAISGINAPAL